jgi:MGT family glycosyltransferase
MAHIAFMSPADAGHVNPTLPVARELVDRGHQVTYATEAKIAESVRSVGAEIVGYELKPMEIVGVDNMDPVARTGYVNLKLLRDVEQALPQIEAGYADDKPGLIVNDFLGWAGPLLAAKWNTPRIQSWSSHAASEGFDFGKIIADMVTASPVSAEIDSLLAAILERHGIPRLELHDFLKPTEANLVYQPRSFHVHNETFDDRYAFVGPTRPPAPQEWTPPGRPLVFVSLGSILSRPDFFHTCIQAFADKHFRVVMSVGHSVDLASLGPLPANIEAHQQVPQTAVLAHTDTFVTHTGMNSAMEALAAAVPMVAIPHTPEEQKTAERIAELGLGQMLAPAEASAQRLAEAVSELLADPKVKHRVREMQQHVRTAGGAPRAADVVESQLNGDRGGTSLG